MRIKINRKYLWLGIAVAFVLVIAVLLFYFIYPDASKNPIFSHTKGDFTPKALLSNKSTIDPQSSDLTQSLPTISRDKTHANIFNDVPEKVRELLKSPIDIDTFQALLDILNDENESLGSRVLALQWLSSAARKLGSGERQILHELTSSIVTKISDPLQLRVLAMRTVIAMSALMRDRGEILQKDAIAENDFIIQIVKDKSFDSSIRAEAIKGIGVLQVDEAASLLENILSNKDEQRIVDITRNATLSLTRLDPEKALPLISQILIETEDTSVFSTAAYSLGKFNSPDAVTTLVQNVDRFPDSGSCDFALVDMEETILKTLKAEENEKDENVFAAIKATNYLWRDGQSLEFVPLLEELVDNPNIEIKKAAVERLMSEAKEKPRDEKEIILERILEKAKIYPELSELSTSIEKILTAETLETKTSKIPTPIPESRRN